MEPSPIIATTTTTILVFLLTSTAIVPHNDAFSFPIRTSSPFSSRRTSIATTSLPQPLQPQQPQTTPHHHRTKSNLYGKLWDKLEIEPDPLDEEPGWYLMNCVAGSELDLLAQAKYVTTDISTELVEKLVVPLERKLRSHGKRKVVETKVMYPGYVFCKMRICADTYEPLQTLPLCRSWMSGTVNRKGYKKLPPAPIALSDEEVAKFKGLEEQTDEIFEKYGEDYTGKGDEGLDLIDQYKGFEVEHMVKVLTGNFKGEDGIVRRLKDGQVCVRLYTYGNVMDQWFDVDDIRPMSDLEAMKGLTGPTTPVNQDEFDVSIGKKPRERDGMRDGPGRRGGRGSMRSNLMGSMGGAGNRMRRQDRQSRGERGDKDIFGRTSEEQKQEEESWRQFREEQRAQQQQKRGDMWGIKERSSWEGGDDNVKDALSPFGTTEGKYKSARQQRRDAAAASSKDVEKALEGGGDWSLFANDGDLSSGGAEEDDFFNSLMSELSDTLDDTSTISAGASPSKPIVKEQQASTPLSTSGSNDGGGDGEDDFFASLMSELSDSIDDGSDIPSESTSSSEFTNSVSNDDDFFASLEADLNESLDGDGGNSGEDSIDDFFASLNLDKDGADDNTSSSSSLSSTDDFFSTLEADLSATLDTEPTNHDNQESTILDTPKKKAAPKEEGKKQQDLSKLTVPILKEMLKERGLKVSGKKSELIERLGNN